MNLKEIESTESDVRVFLAYTEKIPLEVMEKAYEKKHFSLMRENIQYNYIIHRIYYLLDISYYIPWSSGFHMSHFIADALESIDSSYFLLHQRNYSAHYNEETVYKTNVDCYYHKVDSSIRLQRDLEKFPFSPAEERDWHKIMKTKATPNKKLSESQILKYLTRKFKYYASRK